MPTSRRAPATDTARPHLAVVHTNRRRGGGPTAGIGMPARAPLGRRSPVARALILAAIGAATGIGLLACVPAPLPDRPGAGEPVALILDPVSQVVSVTDPTPTPSTVWDRALQYAVKEKGPGPTVTARSAAILHTALYDVWAAYDPVASGSAFSTGFQRPAEENTEANRAAAMNQAAHALLSGMFPEQKDYFDRVLRTLGQDPDEPFVSNRPGPFGKVIAGRAMAERRRDGSNWDDGFEDDTGYAPVNASPLAIRVVDRWTPENTPIDPEDGTPDQTFLTPQWGRVRPFVIDAPGVFRPGAPQPFLATGVSGRVDMASRTLVLADGQTVALGPEAVGPLVNPAFIAQSETVIAASAGLTDRHKMIAEFWEDNKDTTFPPGTWLTFGEYVSARDDHTLDQDAPFFFALSVALLDASIATWEAKVHYDYVRPVRAIRTLGRLDLIGRPGVDALTGERGQVIEAWGGPGQGTRIVLAENFLSYQNPTADPSPPFSEYPSGHSTFSAAAAEVLAAFSGSDRFGGEITFPAGSSRFEPGITPREPLTLRWETFSAAADEAGVSRIYGGIHFPDGDRAGRVLGRAVGREVVARVRELLAGSVPVAASVPAAPVPLEEPGEGAGLAIPPG